MRIHVYAYMAKKFYISIGEYEIKQEIKKLVKRVLRDSLTFQWIKSIVEDEVRKLVKINIRGR